MHPSHITVNDKEVMSEDRILRATGSGGLSLVAGVVGTKQMCCGPVFDQHWPGIESDPNVCLVGPPCRLCHMIVP